MILRGSWFFNNPLRPVISWEKKRGIGVGGVLRCSLDSHEKEWNHG